MATKVQTAVMATTQADILETRAAMAAAFAYLEKNKSCERCGGGPTVGVERRSAGDTSGSHRALCGPCWIKPAGARTATTRGTYQAPASNSRQHATWYRETLLADEAAACARDDARAAAREARRPVVRRRRLDVMGTAKLAGELRREASRIAAEDLGLARRRR